MRTNSPLDKALDSNLNLDLEFVRSQGWVVVPVESAGHFDESDIRRLASSLSSIGCTSLNAVLLEDLANVEPSFSFRTSVEGLGSFNARFGHFCCAIYPDDLSFVIVCTAYDYFLVAGTTPFVESVVGNSIGDARKAFDDFANDAFWREPERTNLRRVSERYKD